MFEQKKIGEVLGVAFASPDLVKRAFIHRSYINEHPKAGLEHNERLEFLGDAVLELVVTDHLYRNYENPEGELTSWRSALVKTESLAEVAEKLSLGQYLLMSHGEVKSGGRSRTALLANLIEAIIGALYLDQGYEAAATFIQTQLIAGLPNILASGAYIDAKSKFQEIAQERDGITPHYEVMSEEGPDHDKIFTVGVFLGKKELGRGNGASKQAGQQAAAADALSRYKK
jgi:ribonuclease-3